MSPVTPVTSMPAPSGWTLARLLKGGPVADRSRLPRYLLLAGVGAVAIWAPILGYLSQAPQSFRSDMSLILPGSGASASVNLDSIGQASSYANSAFASNAVSPTETYKRLLAAERILDAAADAVAMEPRDFGKPRVELVDQTGLIHVSLTGPSPEEARDRLDALRAAFFGEIEALRSDEINTRELGAGAAIDEYRRSVVETRAEITRLQEETGLISPDQYESLVAETDALGRRVADAAADLAERTEAVAALERALGTSPALAAAALRLHADTEFAALADEMSARAADLAQARGLYGPRHPKVQAADAGHASAFADTRARARLLTGLGDDALDRLDLSHVGDRAALLSELVELDTARAGLFAEHAALVTRLAEARAHRDGLISPAARLEDLQRDFAVAEAVFASAMARTQSSKSDLFASYPLVQVLEDPSLPEDPSSPRKKLAIAAGGAAMIMLFFGLFLGWMRRPMIDWLLTAPRSGPHIAPLSGSMGAPAVPAE
ncbi:MAG: hypothetical protein CML68_02180 [Rhodobacteraceae bacterium]|nr:hypothetical protein [Paracoccaceae bacterium]